MRTLDKYVAALCTLGVLVSGCYDADSGAGGLPDDSYVTAIETRVLQGEELTFIKYLDANDEIREVILDADGNAIDPSALPEVRPSKIEPRLQAILDGDTAEREIVQVVVALADDPDVDMEPMESGTVDIDDQGNVKVIRNGVELTPEDVVTLREIEYSRIAARRAARLDRRRAQLRALMRGREHLAAHPAVARALAEGRSTVTLPLEKRDIAAFLRDNDHLVAGLELDDRPQDHLSAAMQDTKVDPYAIDYSGRRGDGIGIYMSESGCPDSGHITNYYRISGSSSDHSKNVSAILRGVSPDSYVYCRSGYTLPTSADLDGYSGNPRVYVENHSWGYTNSDNATYRTYDRDFDDHVYDDAVAVFDSAGNFGDDNGYVGSPAKALNVISVGNYNDSTDTIYSDSSYKDSEIGNAKPELSAPGTSICAGGVGCWTGTSQASPHAAAFAADLMSAYSWLQLKPYYLKASMLAGSDKSISGGSNKVGIGGLDFYRNYYKGTNSWWQGGNGSFDSFDASDYLPNNGYVDRAVTLTASNVVVRVALVWLNRGSYTYDHRTDANPIGMDLDLCAYFPNGALAACSTSRYNPYEVLSFPALFSGTYRIRISRHANRDTSSKLHMGLSIDW